MKKFNILLIIILILIIGVSLINPVFASSKNNNTFNSYLEPKPKLEPKYVSPKPKSEPKYVSLSPESIVPKPQNIEMLSNSPVIIKSEWKIVADLNNEYESFTANYLKNKILESSSLNLDIVDISKIMVLDKMVLDNLVAIMRSGEKSKLASGRKIIVIGNPNNNSTIAQIASLEGIDINKEIQGGFNQGYILNIRPERITILANSTAGTFYGMVSLTWLLEGQDNSIILPHTKITDWPDLEIRGFYGSGDYIWEGKELNTTKDRKEWIEILAKYKYNLYTRSLFDLTETSSQDLINQEIEMQNFLRNMHFKTAAQLTPLTLARYYNENLYEGVQAEDVALKFDENDYATPFKEVDSQEVLLNTDLEEDKDNNQVPDYWLFTEQKLDDYWSMDCSQSHSGVCSAKLNLRKDLTGTITSSAYLQQYVFQRIKLPTDKTYILTFWAKKKEASNNGRNPQFTVVLRDAAGNYRIKSVLMTEGDDKWRQYSLMFSTNDNYTTMYVYSRAQGTAPLELWVDGAEIRLLDDKLLNVIRTPDTELQVWNIDKTIKYIERIDYTLEEEGSFNLANPFLGKKTRIKRIPSGSISEKGKIVVDYDFVVSFQQDADEYNTFADSLIYELYDKYMLKYTMANLDLDYVFIGMDEIRGFNRDSRSKKLGLENYELLAQFTNKIIDMIHSYNPDIKILIWDDMYNKYHNGGDEDYQIPYGGKLGATYYALDLINRDDVVFLSWWYKDDYQGKMANSPNIYNSLGFEFIGGPWDNEKNIKYWSYLCYQNNALGMIDHEFYDGIGGVPIAANYSWNAVKSYPQ